MTNNKKISSTIIFICIALISMFFLSKIASSPQIHSSTITFLDEKKITVMELTTASAVTSAAVAAIPGDATTPIANQISQISSYLLIVVCAILLEKFLITVTGYVSFAFIIPLACLLYIIHLHTKKDFLKKLAIKLTIFGLVIFMVIPISVKISSVIENTYQETITQTIEFSEQFQKEVEEEEEKQKNTEDVTFGEQVSGFISKIGDSLSSLRQKAKNSLSYFIDSIAVLLITSCLIPIAVLLFMFWFVKIIFGINIESKHVKHKKPDQSVTITEK